VGGRGQSAARRLAAGAAALGVALGLALGGAASAHVVVSHASLRQWIQHSAAALRVEIVAGPEIWTASSGDRQEFFRARVLERLAGADVGAREIDFFPHAEGFPGFEPGRQHLLFLERTAGRPEFAGLAARFPWLSAQGAGETWPLDGGEADPVAARARAWAAWLAAGGADVDGLARLIERGLAARDGALQADALSELIRARDLPGLLDRETTARLGALVARPELALSRRAALLRLLAGRRGFDAEAAFATVVRAPASAAEQRGLVQQLGTAELAGVAPWLAGLATDPDPTVRRAVVEAQARRGPRADRALLERALADESPAVARAARRALQTLPPAESDDEGDGSDR